MRINAEELNMMFGDDMEILAKIFDDFKNGHMDMLNAVEAAISSDNASELEITAHTLKGVLATFCADDAKEMSFKLEEMGRAGSCDGAKEIYDDLKAEVVEAVVQLTTLTGSKAA
jgi:two-component system sensor histidine kinase/response regulator